MSKIKVTTFGDCAVVFAALTLMWVLMAPAVIAQDLESLDSATISRQLASPDPIVRLRAAEELARRAAVDQKKLLEGFYLVEKDRKVRLALEWALYRVGKSDSLFRIVRELEFARHDQAVGYLKQLETPTPIYPFLKRSEKPKVTVGLLEALAGLGDSETLELLKPYRDSFAPGVAAAAEQATDQIETRLGQTEVPLSTRPRQTGGTQPTSP